MITLQGLKAEQDIVPTPVMTKCRNTCVSRHHATPLRKSVDSSDVASERDLSEIRGGFLTTASVRTPVVSGKSSVYFTIQPARR